jgi:hypothetical protein
MGYVNQLGARSRKVIHTSVHSRSNLCLYGGTGTVYRGVPLVVGYFFARHFLLAPSVLSRRARVHRVALVIARRQTCSDFRASSAFAFCGSARIAKCSGQSTAPVVAHCGLTSVLQHTAMVRTQSALKRGSAWFMPMLCRPSLKRTTAVRPNPRRCNLTMSLRNVQKECVIHPCIRAV